MLRTVNGEEARLAFLLSHDQTLMVLSITEYMGIDPDTFLEHCIVTMWKAMKSEG